MRDETGLRKDSGLNNLRGYAAASILLDENRKEKLFVSPGLQPGDVGRTTTRRTRLRLKMPANHG